MLREKGIPALSLKGGYTGWLFQQMQKESGKENSEEEENDAMEQRRKDIELSIRKKMCIRDRMREGFIHFLIGQDARIQGYEPVMILFRLLFNGEAPERAKIFTEIYIRNEYTIPEGRH